MPFPIAYKGWRILHNLFYVIGNQKFEPSRWTKVSPALRQEARGIAFHFVKKQAYLQSNVLEDSRALQGPHENNFLQFQNVSNCNAVPLIVYLLLGGPTHPSFNVVLIRPLTYQFLNN